MDGTKVTDKGLAALAGMPGLTSVGVAKTAVTDVGIAKFKEKSPKARVSK